MDGRSQWVNYPTEPAPSILHQRVTTLLISQEIRIGLLACILIIPGKILCFLEKQLDQVVLEQAR